MNNEAYYFPSKIKYTKRFREYFIQTIEDFDKDTVCISKKTIETTVDYLDIDWFNREELTKHKQEIYNHCHYAVYYLLSEENKEKAINDLLADFDDWLYCFCDD